MTTNPTRPDVPVVPAADSLRRALADRPHTDYVFNFWTALGWSILTLGVYTLYVFYQLIRRSRDHNRRQLDMLDAAYQLAWQRAVMQGRGDELRPQFEAVAAELEAPRRMTQDFRDPGIWVVLEVIGGGLVWLIAAILLDQDLVRHERHERAAEAGLAGIFTTLGVQVPAPPQPAKEPHNYVGRVLAALFSLGLYTLWWLYDLMEDGNRHFSDDWPWEDAVAAQTPSLPV